MCPKDEMVLNKKNYMKAKTKGEYLVKILTEAVNTLPKSPLTTSSERPLSKNKAITSKGM